MNSPSVKQMLRNPIILILIIAAFAVVVVSGLPSTSSSVVSTASTKSDTEALIEPAGSATSTFSVERLTHPVSAHSSSSLSQLGPTAAVLTATKTDNTSTPVNPGDTIMYTIEITNTGDANAINLNFTDTIDANTTLVPGSVAVAPIAVNDAYNTIGNVNIQVPVGQGVIANDLNPNGSGTLAVTLVNATPVPGTAATTNGSVTMAADGSFTYTPNAGFTGANDTFIYTLGNSATPGKTDTATVTITVAGRIWFVNSAAGVNADGRLNTPFNILTGAGSADAVDAANDVIFLFSSGTNYTGGITLNSGEKVIGQGASKTILAITGFAAPSGNNLLPATGGSDPVITTAGTVAITLNTNNGLHGFTVGNTGAAGTDISGTSFGTLTVRDVTVNGTGRAFNLATGTMASGSTFDLIESNGGSNTEGARLNAVGGAFTATTTNIVNPTGSGLDVQSSPAATSFNFGGTTVNKNATSGTGVNLNANSGTFAFSSLAVTTNSGTGVSATSSGTVNVTTGSIAATGSPALVVNPTTLGMTFTTVSSTNSGTTGISLTSASGSLSIATTAVTNATGIGINVQGLTSGATAGFGATSITNPDADTTGGAGVRLIDNVGNVSFGDLDITPENGQRAFHATNNVANSGSITTASGTISAVGAIAVEVNRTSAGTIPLMMSLSSVSASGGSNGIFLNKTSGSFTVIGTSGGMCGGAVTNTTTPGTPATITAPVVADCTGGTIQNSTSDGIRLVSAENVSLTRMQIINSGQSGIFGTEVNGFELISSHISNNGNNVDEVGLKFTDVTNPGTNNGLVGSAIGGSHPTRFVNSTVRQSGEFNVEIVNRTGVLTDLLVDGCQFTDTKLNAQLNTVNVVQSVKIAKTVNSD